jgi:hypothetical protein
MARYFGVKCATCDSTIPVAVSRQVQDIKTRPNVVPIEPIFCRVCGSSRGYEQTDGIYFYGPDGLLPGRPMEN